MKIFGLMVGCLCLLCLLFSACNKESAKCGNGVIETGEDCDGPANHAKTCQDLGHQGGDLDCSNNCTFDESACHDWQPLVIVVTGYSATAGEDVPLEGATVALDTPSGDRFELETDVAGKVTFQDIDWSAGHCTVTVHKDGYLMISMAAFDASELEDDLVFNLPSLFSMPSMPLTASGTITGVIDPNHICAVNVLRSQVATEWQGTGNGNWSVQVPRGQPFVIQSIEVEFENLPSGQGFSMPIYRVAQKDYAPIDANISGEVLDFTADEVNTNTADIWVTLPPRADSPLRTGSTVCFVADNQSLYVHGWSTYLDISADGNRFDASLLWTEPDWAEGVITFCRVDNQQNLGYSFSSKDGYPQPGELDTLVDIPRWVAPANPTMAHPMSTPLEWQLFDQDIETQLYVWRDNKIIWQIYSGMDATSFSFPDLPSSVVKDDFLGTSPLSLTLSVGNPDESGTKWERVAKSQAILLAP